jgi:tetratricopeptide (TPR) repeat protein
MSSNLVNQLHSRAIRFHKEGKYDRAIETFQAVIEEDPEFSRAYYNLANLYADLEQLDDALEMYLAAVKLGGNIASTWYNIGNLYLDMEKFELAIEAFDTSLEVKPDFLEVKFNKAIVLTHLNSIDEAITLYEEIIAEKKFHYASYNLSCLLVKNGELDRGLDKLAEIVDMKYDVDYHDLIAKDPYFDGIRNDPRLIDIISKFENTPD